MSYKVDTGIPIPIAAKGRPVGWSKYPFAELKVGDSFFVPDLNISSITGTANRIKQHTGHTYTCRTVDGGVRVWRIA